MLGDHVVVSHLVLISPSFFFPRPRDGLDMRGSGASAPCASRLVETLCHLDIASFAHPPLEGSCTVAVCRSGAKIGKSSNRRAASCSTAEKIRCDPTFLKLMGTTEEGRVVCAFSCNATNELSACTSCTRRGRSRTARCPLPMNVHTWRCSLCIFLAPRAPSRGALIPF